MQIIYRLVLSVLLALQLSLASALPSQAHVSGELAGGAMEANGTLDEQQLQAALIDLGTDKLVDSLLNGARNQRLKVSRDGRIFNGNHRIEALRERGYDLGNLRNQINSSQLHDTGNSFIPTGLE